MKSILSFTMLLVFGAVNAIACTTSDRGGGCDVPAGSAGQTIKIKAADGLEIAGSFYPVTGKKAPAVLMLHDGVSTRAQWSRHIPSLIQAGYNVLAVDQRGMGETKTGPAPGSPVELQDKDVPMVLAWLRQQPSVEAGAVAIIGARLGANFAIRACAGDDRCRAVVALTPAADYFGITTEDALRDMREGKAVLLVATQHGENGAMNIKKLHAAASPAVNMMTRLYGAEFGFGTDMLNKDPGLMAMILLWLETYNRPRAQGG